MTDIVVFCGPTIDGDTAREHLDAVFLPPAAQGDVYRAAVDQPAAIAIIDGYFERVPAVWHKEILWAIENGVAVYGAASMGALRAAELAMFNMQGTGWIYESFAAGRLTDDDEVAVAHAGPDDRYRPLSEAMVNVRRTVDAAVADAVVSAASAEVLRRTAKQLFYPDRVWGRILAEAADQLGDDELDRLRVWLPTGRVDQKRLDAIELLDLLATEDPAVSQQKPVKWRMEHTIWWDHLESHCGDPGLDVSRSEGLLEELRLRPREFADAFEGALLRHLSLAEATRRHIHLADSAVQEMADRFRMARGLVSDAEVDRWLAGNDLDDTTVTQLMAEEATLAAVRSQLGGDIHRRLPSTLKSSGQYAGLAQRAREKTELLASIGLEDPGLEDVGMTEDELYAWFFARLGISRPDDIDLYAASSGYENGDALRRAVVRERCYVSMGGAGS